MTTPLSREQVLEFIDEICDYTIAKELPHYPQKLRDTDASLRAQLDTSMRRQETLAKNVQDGLLEIRALRAKLSEGKVMIDDIKITPEEA